MSKLLAIALCGVLFVATGCKSDDDHHDRKTSGSTKMEKSETMKSGGDVCTHCPGVQTTKADGTCSGCGMKVTAAK